jgi:hypothetical protein
MILQLLAAVGVQSDQGMLDQQAAMIAANQAAIFQQQQQMMMMTAMSQMPVSQFPQMPMCYPVPVGGDYANNFMMMPQQQQLQQQPQQQQPNQPGRKRGRPPKKSKTANNTTNITTEVELAGPVGVAPPQPSQNNREKPARAEWDNSLRMQLIYAVKKHWPEDGDNGLDVDAVHREFVAATGSSNTRDMCRTCWKNTLMKSYRNVHGSRGYSGDVSASGMQPWEQWTETERKEMKVDLFFTKAVRLHYILIYYSLFIFI